MGDRHHRQVAVVNCRLNIKIRSLISNGCRFDRTRKICSVRNKGLLDVRVDRNIDHSVAGLEFKPIQIRFKFDYAKPIDIDKRLVVAIGTQFAEECRCGRRAVVVGSVAKSIAGRDDLPIILGVACLVVLAVIPCGHVGRITASHDRPP